MEPFSSSVWNPEWIWGVALIVFGLVLAYATLHWKRRSSHQSIVRSGWPFARCVTPFPIGPLPLTHKRPPALES